MKVLVCLGFVFGMTQGSLNAQNATAQQYYQAGTKLYNAKNYTQAAQYYGAAIKLDPNYADAYQGIGSCYYMLGNKQYALSYFQKALQLNPNNTQLAQVIQSLGGQAPAGGGTTTTTVAAGDPLAQGTALYQQKQYAAAIPYFQQSIQQNPNNYQPYYYAALAYYGNGDAKDAALYFAMAYQKQPTNAGIKAYADRLKAGLPPADQQWVDDQVSKMSGGTAVAGGASKPGFGVRLITGMHYVLSDPTQIVQAAQAVNVAQAANPSLPSVAFSGTTPNFSFSGGLELFYQISPNFELNLGGSMTPLSNLQYISSYSGFLTPSNYPLSGSQPVYSNPPSYSTPAVFQYTYGASVLTGGLGGKLFFGDPKTVKFSAGLGVDISPISLTFSKSQLDPTKNNTAMSTSDPNYLDYNVSGTYSTMAIGGHLTLGMDFALGNNLSLGLYAGYRFLNASSFQSGSDTLQVNNDTSDVGPSSQFTASFVSKTSPLSLDFSGAIEGLDLSISF